MTLNTMQHRDTPSGPVLLQRPDFCIENYLGPESLVQKKAKGFEFIVSGAGSLQGDKVEALHEIFYSSKSYGPRPSC